MSSGKRSTLKRAVLQAVRGVAITAAALSAAVFLISTFQTPGSRGSRDADDAPKAAAQASSPIREEAVVKLDPGGQEKGGIETAAPKETAYQGQARAYGSVLPLDRLTSLYNASLAASAQLNSAEVKLSASKTASERARNLLKVFPTAVAQVESAEAAVRIDAAAVETAQAEVEAVKNSAIQEWGPVLGEAILARSPLAEGLVRRKTALIQLTLQPGATVAAPDRISVALGGGSTTEADFVSEATQADPKIPNVSYFYTIPMAPGALAGISVQATLPNGAAKAGVGIPPSAVIWQEGKAWIYVRAGSDRFERRAIGEEAAPTADGGYVLPATSLQHDRLIVVAGAQTLLSEESKMQIPSDEDSN
jgi:hypothetical protein